ncbi:hypothetical protein [Methanocalculus taiwanensis]|nr:hypothetical protein [Methanocalculus taiwanensis]
MSCTPPGIDNRSAACLTIISGSCISLPEKSLLRCDAGKPV